jgi:hypothetical protein
MFEICCGTGEQMIMNLDERGMIADLQACEEVHENNNTIVLGRLERTEVNEMPALHSAPSHQRSSHRINLLMQNKPVDGQTQQREADRRY